MNLHEFEIVLEASPAGERRIKIDGREIHGVTSLLVSAAVDDVPRVSLTFIPKRIKIRGDGANLGSESLEDYRRLRGDGTLEESFRRALGVDL